MRTLLLLRGAPCSGKSTWIKENGLSDFTLSLDDFRKLVSPKLMKEENGDLIHYDSIHYDYIAWEALISALEFRMKNGLFTIIDATHSNNDALKPYHKLVEKYKYSMFYYQFDTDLDILCERNIDRAATSERNLIDKETLTVLHTLIQSVPLYVPKRIYDLKEIMHFYTKVHTNGKVKVIGAINGNAVIFKELIEEAKGNLDTLYVFTGAYFGKMGETDKNPLIAEAIVGDDAPENSNFKEVSHYMPQNIRDEWKQFVHSVTTTESKAKTLYEMKWLLCNNNGNYEIFKLLVNLAKNKQSNIVLLESEQELFMRDLIETTNGLEFSDKEFKIMPCFETLKSIVLGMLYEERLDPNSHYDEETKLSDYYKQNMNAIKNKLHIVYKSLMQMLQLDTVSMKSLISHNPLPAFAEKLTVIPTCFMTGRLPNNKDILSFDKEESVNLCQKYIIGSRSKNGGKQGVFVKNDTAYVFLNESGQNKGVSVPVFDLASKALSNRSEEIMQKANDLYQEKHGLNKAEQSNTHFVFYTTKHHSNGRNSEKHKVKKIIPKTQSKSMNDFIQSGLNDGLLRISVLDKHNLLSINFNSDAFFKSRWNDVTKKARGLFIDATTGEVKMRSYNKFFNYNELSETKESSLKQHLQYPVKVFHKYNGFLGIASVINGELVLATKSQITGQFVKMFQEIVSTVPVEEVEAIKKALIENNASATFEVCHLNDPHIIEYKSNAIYLLDFIKNEAIDDFKSNFDFNFSQTILDSVKSKLQQIKVKELVKICNNWNDVKEVIDETENAENPLKIEGYVLQDARGFQFKLKTHYYKMWKKMRTIGFSKSIKRKQGISSNETEIQFLTWLSRNQSKIVGERKQLGLKTDLSIIDYRNMFEQEKQ